MGYLLKKNTSILNLVASVVISFLAEGDHSSPMVACVSHDAFPQPQCASSSSKIKISSELGEGDEADYQNAEHLFVQIEGPNDGGDLEKVEIVVQKSLAAAGLEESGGLTIEGGEVVLREGEVKADFLRARNAVVIVDQNSGVPEVDIDVSSHIEGIDGGSAVIVADSIDKLTIKVGGYDGRDGDSALRNLAKKSVIGSGGIPGDIAAAYLQRRRDDPSVGLDFDSSDLNNYEASGLRCAGGETAVGTSGSYAFDNAGIRGPYRNDSAENVPQGVDVVAFVREEAKRTFCQRRPEFTLVQECEAEKEYSLQAVCRVESEARSKRFFKRDPVRWQRAICAPSTNTKVRRRIVRQAQVQIVIPGGKSYSGLVSRSISFAETKDVLRRRVDVDKLLTTPTNRANAADPEEGLIWFNPFWRQSAGIGVDEDLEVNSSIIINNGYNEDAFPAIAEGRQLRGVKLLYVPRKNQDRPCDDAASAGGCFRESEDLFGFEADNSDLSLFGPSMTGCAPLIDLGGDEVFSTSQIIGSSALEEGKFESYKTYFKAFDANTIGFSAADLKIASLIKVTQCFAYEVLEAVVEGNLVRGKWNKVAGTVEREVTDRDSSITGNEVCPQAFPEQVGIETFIQYEKETHCYASDPRHPPEFLRQKEGLDGGAKQQDFLVEQLSGKDWHRGDSYPGDPVLDQISPPPPIDLNPIWEINFPDTVTAAEKDRLGDGSGGEDRKKYCVHQPSSTELDSTSPRYWDRINNPGMWPVASRAVEVPNFTFRQNSRVATPQIGNTKKVCPTGIRLDSFLANVPKISCPVDFDPDAEGIITNGSSTKLLQGEWSSAYSAPVWETFEQREEPGNEVNYSLRTTALDSRYDDLPAQIYTTQTHAVHPGVFAKDTSGEFESFSGREFPPTYGFSETVDGRRQRVYPGWIRESSLVSSEGAIVSAGAFTPFGRGTLSQRTQTWCNADAFVELGDGALVQGFGARGILRDAPKRIFGFSLEQYDEEGEGKFISSTPYLGVEITGRGSGGFFTYRDFPEKTAKAIAEDLEPEDFMAVDFPFIGARFQETCGEGEVFDFFLGVCRVEFALDKLSQTCTSESGLVYNTFLGACISPSASWLGTSRVIDYIDHDGSRSPWNLLLSKETLEDSDTSRPYEFPFHLFEGGEPRGDSETLTGNGFPELVQLGFLRDSVNMVESGDLAVFLNRPESLGKMIMAPGFAGSLRGGGAACNVRTRILAIPADRTNAIDLDNKLPTGTAIIAFDSDCDQDGGFTLRASIRRLNASGNLDVNAVSVATTTLEVEPSVNGHRRISLNFNNSANAPLFKMRDIYETIIAGLSATTGFETLVPVKLEPPLQRSRAAEWQDSQRVAVRGEWRNRIKTRPTDATTDGGATSLACAVKNQDNDAVQIEGDVTGSDGVTVTIGIKGGVWQRGAQGGDSIINGGAENCDLPEGRCALTAEEASLFTKSVVNSEARQITRSAATQWTPWSFELAPDAPKNSDHQTQSIFGEWTEIGNLQAGASVPDCSSFDAPGAGDELMVRNDFDQVLKTEDLEIAGFPTIWRIPHPVTDDDFMIVPYDPNLRISRSCLRWDDVRGDVCQVVHPTIGGPEVTPYIFGGEWDSVFVERKERISQVCHEFGFTEEVSLVNGEAVGTPDLSRCKKGNLCEAGPSAPVVTDQLNHVGPRAYNADGSCFKGLDNGAGGVVTNTGATSVRGHREALRDPRVEFCTPDTCPFQTNIQTFQVDAATPASGRTGEDGTAAGSATIFCRNCPEINFEAAPGRGGLGSNPVGSDRSKILTCVKSNNNPLNPIFSVRHLWSQPFVGGSAGQNGRAGAAGEGVRVFQDMSSEAIWQLSQPDFWKNE